MMSSAAAMTARLPELATARGAATGTAAWSIVTVPWLTGTVPRLIGVVGWLICVVGWLTGTVPGPTGTIVPVASIPANRAHAPYQPSGVLGHRSDGCECGAPAAQIP